MKDFLQYIFYSGVCLGIFWLVYRLLLSKTTFFQFNRFYLLAGLMLSFILPAFVITYEVLLPATVAVRELAAQGEVKSAEYNWLNVWLIALSVYLLGMLLLLVRNLQSYRTMCRLTKKGQKTEYAGYKVVYNKSVDSPFTLFDRIFMSTGSISEVEKELILKHEIVHIDQKHWLDLVCSECALMLQWFNPFVWLYVSSIKENHEYQADGAVLAEGISPAKYQAVLINQRFQGPVFSFSNSFSLTNKSNRLSMIKKEKSKSWKRAAVLAVLPLLGAFFWVSAKPHYVLDIRDADKVVEVNDTTPKKVKIKIVGPKGAYFDSITLQNIPADVSEPNIEGQVTELKRKPASIYIYGLDTLSGKAQNVRLEVTNSTNLSKEPLLIIDGEEVNYGVMSSLKPADIESLEVFKDKTATDLYGEKGENGVIKVTLKKNE